MVSISIEPEVLKKRIEALPQQAMSWRTMIQRLELVPPISRIFRIQIEDALRDAGWEYTDIHVRGKKGRRWRWRPKPEPITIERIPF